MHRNAIICGRGDVAGGRKKGFEKRFVGWRKTKRTCRRTDLLSRVSRAWKKCCVGGRPASNTSTIHPTVLSSVTARLLSLYLTEPATARILRRLFSCVGDSPFISHLFYCWQTEDISLCSHPHSCVLAINQSIHPANKQYINTFINQSPCPANHKHK